MSQPRALRLAFVLLLSALAWALSQGDLYGPEAPRDAAYLRVVNAASAEPIAPVVDGNEWQRLEFAQVSPYRQVDPGEHEAIVGEARIELTAEPESFTTVVALPQETIAIADTPLRDISRGLLTLYNLSGEGNLSLRTEDGTEVLADVAPRSQSSVAISEAEVALAVRRDGEPFASLPSQLYGRGEAHSIFVLPLGSEPKVVYIRAAAER